MTVKCPSCRSDSVRRSHARREDGLLRALFLAAYRCRNCHARFYRIGNGSLLVASLALIVVAAIGLGWALHSYFPDVRVDAEPVAVAEPPAVVDPESAELPGEAIGAPNVRTSLADLADSGDAKAQFQLGMAFRTGEGGKADNALAYQWFLKSAKQGLAHAQFAVASMHLAGSGVLQSFPLAFEWFERAAQQNHADAQYQLGRMYRRGYGVATSNVKAYVWFNLAAAQGHDRAREARDNLLPLMTPEQIAAAQRESHEWRPLAAN